MSNLNEEAQRIFKAKQSRRLALSRLTFPEKVEIIIRLQKMAAPLFRARGRNVRVWTPTS
jgi:energy-coupling factor transporter transmembrane protein EcfT